MAVLAGHRIQLMLTSDDQPKDIPALLDYRRPPVGTTSRNTIQASSRLLLARTLGRGSSVRFVCPLGRLPLTYRDADQAGAMLQGISSGRGPMRSLRAIRASHVGSVSPITGSSPELITEIPHL